MAEKRVMTFNVPARTREKLEFISGFTGLDFTSVVINAIDVAYAQYAFEKAQYDALNTINIGDRVSAGKSVLGRVYRAVGTVVEKRLDDAVPLMCIETTSGTRDWYEVANDVENYFRVLTEEENAEIDIAE